MHRHELRGALHGLIRVRCFTQDDAHIFMHVRTSSRTRSSASSTSSTSVYQMFGFKYHVELSTRPEDSHGQLTRTGSARPRACKTALSELGMDYEVNEGDGAFYGPKIDFHLRGLPRPYLAVRYHPAGLPDARATSTSSTPVPTATKQRPIMLHRVVLRLASSASSAS